MMDSAIVNPFLDRALFTANHFLPDWDMGEKTYLVPPTLDLLDDGKSFKKEGRKLDGYRGDPASASEDQQKKLAEQDAEKRVRNMIVAAGVGGLIVSRVEWLDIKTRPNMLSELRKALLVALGKATKFEIDFVIMVPRFGVVALEVKAFGKKPNHSAKAFIKAKEQVAGNVGHLCKIYKTIFDADATFAFAGVVCMPNAPMEERTDYWGKEVFDSVVRFKQVWKELTCIKSPKVSVEFQRFCALLFGLRSIVSLSVARNALEINRAVSQVEYCQQRFVSVAAHNNEDEERIPIFLTPEQLLVLECMAKCQLITGLPGTGKTLLLMSKMCKIVQMKSTQIHRKLVYFQQQCQLLYRKNPMKRRKKLARFRMQLLDITAKTVLVIVPCKLIEMYQKFFYHQHMLVTPRVCDKMLLFNGRPKLLAQLCRSPMVDVFMDENDVGDYEIGTSLDGQTEGGKVHELLMRRSTLNAWTVCVPGPQFAIDFKKIPSQMLSMLPKAVTVHNLNKIIRGTSSVISFWLGSISAEFTSSLESSSIGHAIDGMPVDEAISYSLEDLVASVCRAVSRYLHATDGSHISDAVGVTFKPKHIAIIVSDRHTEETRDSLRTSLDSLGLELGGFSCGTANEQLFEENMIALDEASPCRSYEWPVVVAVPANDQDDDFLAYSRAISVLIVRRLPANDEEISRHFGPKSDVLLTAIRVHLLTEANYMLGELWMSLVHKAAEQCGPESSFLFSSLLLHGYLSSHILFKLIALQLTDTLAFQRLQHAIQKDVSDVYSGFDYQLAELRILATVLDGDAHARTRSDFLYPTDQDVRSVVQRYCAETLLAQQISADYVEYRYNERLEKVKDENQKCTMLRSFSLNSVISV